MLDFATFNDLVVQSGMTKKKIAEICSVDVTTITRWCKNSDLVPVKCYHKLSSLVFYIRYELPRVE